MKSTKSSQNLSNNNKVDSSKIEHLSQEIVSLATTTLTKSVEGDGNIKMLPKKKSDLKQKIESLDDKELKQLKGQIKRDVDQRWYLEDHMLETYQDFINKEGELIKEATINIMQDNSLSEDEKEEELKHKTKIIFENYARNTIKIRDEGLIERFALGVFHILQTVPSLVLTSSIISFVSDTVLRPMQNAEEAINMILQFSKNNAFFIPKNLGPLVQQLDEALKADPTNMTDALHHFQEELSKLFTSPMARDVAGIGLIGSFIASKALGEDGLLSNTSEALHQLSNLISKIGTATFSTSFALKIPLLVLTIYLEHKRAKEMEMLHKLAIANTRNIKHLEVSVEKLTEEARTEHLKLENYAILKPSITTQDGTRRGSNKSDALNTDAEEACLSFFSLQASNIIKERKLPRPELPEQTSFGKKDGRFSINDLYVQAMAEPISKNIVSIDGYLDTSKYSLDPIINPFKEVESRIVVTKNKKHESVVSTGKAMQIYDALHEKIAGIESAAKRQAKKTNALDAEIKNDSEQWRKHFTGLQSSNSIGKKEMAISNFIDAENELIQKLKNLLQIQTELENAQDAILNIRTLRNQLYRTKTTDALGLVADQIDSKKFSNLTKDILGSAEHNQSKKGNLIINKEAKSVLFQLRNSMLFLASKIPSINPRDIESEIPYDLNKTVVLSQEFKKGIEEAIEIATKECVAAAANKVQKAKEMAKMKIFAEHKITNPYATLHPEGRMAGRKSEERGDAAYLSAKKDNKVPNRILFNKGDKPEIANMVINRKKEIEKLYIPMYVTDKNTGKKILVRTTKIKSSPFNTTTAQNHMKKYVKMHHILDGYEETKKVWQKSLGTEPHKIKKGNPELEGFSNTTFQEEDAPRTEGSSPITNKSRTQKDLNYADLDLSSVKIGIKTDVRKPVKHKTEYAELKLPEPKETILKRAPSSEAIKEIYETVLPKSKRLNPNPKEENILVNTSMHSSKSSTKSIYEDKKQTYLKKPFGPNTTIYNQHSDDQSEYESDANSDLAEYERIANFQSKTAGFPRPKSLESQDEESREKEIRVNKILNEVLQRYPSPKRSSTNTNSEASTQSRYTDLPSKISPERGVHALKTLGLIPDYRIKKADDEVSLYEDKERFYHKQVDIGIGAINAEEKGPHNALPLTQRAGRKNRNSNKPKTRGMMLIKDGVSTNPVEDNPILRNYKSIRQKSDEEIAKKFLPKEQRLDLIKYNHDVIRLQQKKKRVKLRSDLLEQANSMEVDNERQKRTGSWLNRQGFLAETGALEEPASIRTIRSQRKEGNVLQKAIRSFGKSGGRFHY